MPNDLRPLTLGELLDRCFFLYRKNFLLFSGIMALPYLVLLAFQLAGIGFQTWRSTAGVAVSVLWTLATLVLTLGVTAASQGATVIAVSHLHLDQPTSIMESFAGIKGRILYLALIMIGYGIGVGVGFVLLIVPGIILALMWALTIPVAVLEDKGLRDSVNRSAELTKGSRGRVFVVYLLFLVLTYAVIMVWELPILAVVGVTARSHPGVGVPLWALIALQVGTFVSQCLVGPLMTIGLSLLYYDQRVRKEGFDLQHMMATLDATTLDGTVPAVGV
ncbi:MAG: glycerophosphoryl diester phosphodiesterase membrane domain-containing protein [Terriglobales bacterium]